MQDSSCPSTDDRSPAERWSNAAVAAIYDMRFNDLLHRALTTHRAHFNPNTIQLSTLLNIKSGGCPEDCAYCPQSARYQTGVEATGLLTAAAVKAAAERARSGGASRFCMGAAWRELKDRDVTKIVELIRVVKDLGMESCVTLGMLTAGQARELKQAGLDYYNHNIDCDESYYESIISTRAFEDRLRTLDHVRDAGINVCCGGIIGMGESREHRIGFLRTLANLPEPPESVPINMLVRAPGTPLAGTDDLDPLDLVRTIATARIMMPDAWVRLSAGRSEMSDELQALCFLAGANSIFYGDRLLTTDNPEFEQDQRLFARLGLNAAPDPTASGSDLT